MDNEEIMSEETIEEPEVIDAPENASTEEQLAAEKDKYLRLAAEYDNFRRRSRSERDALYSDVKAETVKSFLDVYDVLALALKVETSDTAYKQGVELTMRKLTDILDRLGVSAIIAEPGTKFDPEQHNAIAHIEDENLGADVVAEELSKGFKLGDKVIRYSMVKAAN
ncbi:MAG: nucleotide exchange factor GrpE [Oscillospiraceae bacterium]|jgi:molecular chaperone GrpE|nr:nucleotide exchange factor GrpE [Oscillospiraceae bacterium]